MDHASDPRGHKPAELALKPVWCRVGRRREVEARAGVVRYLVGTGSYVGNWQ